VAGITYANYHFTPPVVWLVKTDFEGKMEWNQTYDYLLNAAGLVQTRDGGYAIAGNGYRIRDLYNTATLQPIGVMLLKTDLNGSVQWSRTYKGWSGGASSMAQTNDGGYIIAGSSGNSGFLIKTDASGRTQWNGTYGEPNKYNSFSSVIQTSDSGYVLGGVTNPNGTSGDNYNLHFWLVKTDGYGNVMWSQIYGVGPGDVTDGHRLKYDTPGDNHAISVVQTSDGGYVLAGNTRSYDEGIDAWLVKTDSHGNMLWNQTYGGAGLVTLHSGAGDAVVGSDETGYDFAYSLIQTSDGGLAFAGKTLGYLAWLVKLDAAGNAEWNHTYPNRQMGGGGWSANCLIETSDGGFALAGLWDYSDSVNYYYLAKTEPVLPPPTPTPTPSSPPSTGFLSGENLVLFASLAVAAVLIALVAVAVFRRRKKQTLPASFT
jgi:hypothetical protein